jgi:3-hydroxybutyryl-CoA dehydrogenase
MLIGIVGAGTMGSGIALAFARQGGHAVVLTDVDIDLARSGKGRIREKLSKMVQKGQIAEEESEVILRNVEAGCEDTLASCDLVLEAIIERLEPKKTLFLRLMSICGKNTIFASNTSSLSVSKIGEGLDRPVVGLHFFNPAEMMPLVEIVADHYVPEGLVNELRTLAVSIGKTAIVVADSPGFVVNRILIPMINEAIAILDDGVASALDIDAAMKLGANHPMGPLGLADLIGLDVCLSIMEVLHSELADDKYQPHPLLVQMVADGRLGRKTGLGFFAHR